MLQKQHILIAILLFVPFLGGGLGLSASTLDTFLANLEQQTLQSDFTITTNELPGKNHYARQSLFALYV